MSGFSFVWARRWPAYSLGKATLFFKHLGQDKYEVLITRISGALIAAFGVYMIIVESKPLFS